MNKKLFSDKENFSELLEEAKKVASKYLMELDHRTVNVLPKTSDNYRKLPNDGYGTLKDFEKNYYKGLTASSGPRSFGYVVGGSTPASIIGNWLTSAFDQDNGEGITIQLEDEAIEMAKELFGLSKDFLGSFVSGATMSNFVGLACARQWVAQNQNIDIAETGLYNLEKIKVFSATPHSSIYKSLSMLGMGRDSLIKVKSEKDSEKIDLKDLIKVTIFLSDRKYRDLNSKIRQEILKEVSPSLTIIITGIYEEEWLLEIEAIAGK